MARIDGDTLQRLCIYFGCTVGDILEYVGGQCAGGNSVNVSQSDLNTLRAFAESVRVLTFAVPGYLRSGDAAGLHERLQATRYETIAAIGILEAAGADRPADLPAAIDVPLHLLDTPANRHLLDCLRSTLEAARAVDSERGYDSDGGPADMYAMFLARVATEVLGRAGGLG